MGIRMEISKDISSVLGCNLNISVVSLGISSNCSRDKNQFLIYNTGFHRWAIGTMPIVLPPGP
jgi:hypothetical protein